MKVCLDGNSTFEAIFRFGAGWAVLEGVATRETPGKWGGHS